MLQLDNFRKLKGFGWPGFKAMNLRRQDKGQRACAAAFLDAVAKGGAAPIEVKEIFEVARVSINVAGGQSGSGNPLQQDESKSILSHTGAEVE